MLIRTPLTRVWMYTWIDVGTLAKHIMTEPSEIKTTAGVMVPLKMSVEYISFSAHSDFKQTREFVDILQPPYIVGVEALNDLLACRYALICTTQQLNV